MMPGQVLVLVSDHRLAFAGGLQADKAVGENDPGRMPKHRGNGVRGGDRVDEDDDSFTTEAASPAGSLAAGTSGGVNRRLGRERTERA